MTLEMQRPIFVRREHPTGTMIPDVSTSTETNSKSATSLEYFHLFKSLAELDAEPGFKMVAHRLLADNESVQMASLASLANSLPPLKGKDVTIYGFLPSSR